MNSFSLTLDMGYDFFVDTLGEEDGNNLSEGQDFTDILKANSAVGVDNILSAIILIPIGPAGGNPFVKVDFTDGEAAAAWFMDFMGGDEMDFDMAIA